MEIPTNANGSLIAYNHKGHKPNAEGGKREGAAASWYLELMLPWSTNKVAIAFISSSKLRTTSASATERFEAVKVSWLQPYK